MFSTPNKAVQMEESEKSKAHKTGEVAICNNSVFSNSHWTGIAFSYTLFHRNVQDWESAAIQFNCQFVQIFESGAGNCEYTQDM